MTGNGILERGYTRSLLGSLAIHADNHVLSVFYGQCLSRCWAKGRGGDEKINNSESFIHCW